MIFNYKGYCHNFARIKLNISRLETEKFQEPMVDQQMLNQLGIFIPT